MNSTLLPYPVEARSNRGTCCGSSDEVLVRFSHEFRNFLCIIRSAMHVMKHGAVANLAHEEARALMEREVAQMAHLIDDLLDIARARHGPLQLRRSRLDVCMVVTRALHAVQGITRQREQRTAVYTPGVPVWVSGDAERLEQVFVNLLLNAAKYTGVGGSISLVVRVEGGTACVIVRDTGIGMAADLLPKVFDPYVQANPSARAGGLGLGLPLVRSLVESHGGSVTAASDGVGRGSSFDVRLPVIR